MPHFQYWRRHPSAILPPIRILIKNGKKREEFSERLNDPLKNKMITGCPAEVDLRQVPQFLQKCGIAQWRSLMRVSKHLG